MMEQQQREQQHAWEQTDAAQMWSESIQEDADGNLLHSSHQRDAAALVRLRRRRLARSDYARSNRRLVRDMIRYAYVVLDCSHVMYERDPALPGGGGATRFDVVLTALSAFVEEYYDQNPLSQLGLVVVRDGEAEMVTRLTGSRAAHGAGLVQLRRDVGRSVASDPRNAGGVFSLQNGLEVAGRSLGHMPRYGSREILVLMGGLATCDPGDVLVDTLPRLRAAGVRVSTVALQAEVHVCRRIAAATGGILGVCLDRGHLRDLILGQCTPPPARPGEDDGNPTTRKCAFVQMGFPPHRTDDVPSLVHAGSSRGGSSDAHRALLVRAGYVCPRCRAKTAELPADCAVCGLKLVLAPHLARSFHHLFPVPPFAEVAEEVDVAAQQHDDDDAAVDGSCGGGGSNNETAPPAAAADVIGSAPPSSVAADADVTSSAPTFEVVSSRGTATATAAEPPATRTVRIDAKLLVASRECDRCCFACLKIIGVHRPAQQPADGATAAATKKRRTTESVVTAASSAPASAAAGSGNDPYVLLADRPEPLRFQCPDCRNVFCADCDAYLHETLHNCPGCLCA